MSGPGRIAEWRLPWAKAPPRFTRSISISEPCEGPLTPDLLARLAQHRSLGQAPPAEHEWLAAHGQLQRFELGEVVTAKGTPATRLLVVFSGHLVIRMDRGAGAHKVFEWKAGDVGGVMPYSRGASPPNDVIAEETTETLTLDKELFPEMIRECPVVTATMVHAMIDRARMFTSSDLRDEKLLSLGKLASGLAHELNNPASAVVRSATMLTKSLDTAEEAARRLGAAHLSAEQLGAIDRIRKLCVAPPAPEAQSALARADREDAISEWLAAHNANPMCSGPLAETPITVAELDSLAATVGGEALDPTLRWLSAGCQVRALSREIETAATRIHGLVAAVKGFSYMDRAPTAEPVDVRRGIADTLTMLGSKIRGKSLEISVDLPENLPCVHGVGAELNQVWMNLIDNALDAAPEKGHVTIAARGDHDHLTVRIVDDGPGIPAEIKGRIFDPFFTTKGVGKGTGLGLDIVRRLLQRGEGEVAVESEPGKTEFQVRLPMER